MKYIKQVLSGLLLAAAIFSICTFPAMAYSEPEISTDIIFFEDGSYLVVTLREYQPAAARTIYGRTGSKSGEYYNSDGELCWDFTVHGTFEYDGTTATATDASYSYNIYNSVWKLKSAEAYCSGNQTIAEGKFNGGFLLNRSTSITLTCSPTGVLS